MNITNNKTSQQIAELPVGGWGHYYAIFLIITIGLLSAKTIAIVLHLFYCSSNGGGV